MSAISESKTCSLSEVEKQSLHHMHEIEGVTFRDLSVIFGLDSAADARKVFDEVSQENLRIHKSMSASMRVSQLRRYEDLFRQSRREFEGSKRPRKTTTVKFDANDVKQGSEVRVEEESTGDPRMLRMAMDSARAIDALLGLDAPKSVKVEQNTTHDVTIRFEQMSIAELEQYTILAKLRRQGLIVLDQEPESQALPAPGSETQHVAAPPVAGQQDPESLQTLVETRLEDLQESFQFQS